MPRSHADLLRYKREWKRNKDARVRAGLGLDRWPCAQCSGDIVFRKRGNRRRICLDCAPTHRYALLVRRYGVDRHMYEAMYFEQNGKCAIGPCNREARCVDHDHQTGHVRGLVCQGCNAALGFVESAFWLRAALDYLQLGGVILR